MLGCLFAHSKATMCTYVRSQHVAFLGTWRLLYEESPISHAVQRAGWGARAGGALREGFRVGRHPSARNLTVLGITPHARAEWMLPTLTLILLVRCRFRSAAPPFRGARPPELSFEMSPVGEGEICGRWLGCAVVLLVKANGRTKGTVRCGNRLYSALGNELGTCWR